MSVLSYVHTICNMCVDISSSFPYFNLQVKKAHRYQQASSFDMRPFLYKYRSQPFILCIFDVITVLALKYPYNIQIFCVPVHPIMFNISYLQTFINISCLYGNICYILKVDCHELLNILDGILLHQEWLLVYILYVFI